VYRIFFGLGDNRTSKLSLLPYMQIYLLRHGNAAGVPAKQNVVIDAIFSSPHIRVQQTAAIMNQTFNVKEYIMTEYLISGTDHSQLIGKLNGQSFLTILLVGHGLHLSSFISFLLSESRCPNIVVGEGSLACVESSDPIQIGSGLLRWFLPTECMM